MTAAWTNVTDAVFHHAATRPDAVALVEGPTWLTFSEFASLIAKATVYLRQQGIKAGDRVGVRMTNSADHIILSLALLRLGAAKFELSPNAEAGELEAITRKFSLATLFIEPPMKLYRGARCLPVDLSWRPSLLALEGDARHDDGIEPFYVALTSGSSGTPKAIPVSHRQIIGRFVDLASGHAQTGMISLERPGNFMLIGSLAFSDFHNFMLTQLMAGACIVVLPEFGRFYDIVRYLNHYDDTVTMLTPAMCDALLACAPKSGVLLPRMRFMTVGGQSTPPDIKKAMINRVTPHFHDLYACPGAGVIALQQPSEMPRRGDSVGKPVTGVEVEIVDAAGKPLGANRIGYLRCRGDFVSANFLMGEDATWEPGEGFRDGWYYPGDLASMDSSGFVFIKGRTSDIIRRNGIEVYPAEIEAAIASHPSVKEAAVIGLPARRGGHDVIAIVVPKTQPDHDEITQHCETKLTPEKRPGGIAYMDALPRTANGKVNRTRVRELAQIALKRAEAMRKTRGTA
ncbi:class I adenylate-forming enzyme family protein [Iodidimonas sp. SYSU 1G8]|uniref:class I adenylate-forming enzyme family protein n=1 Tax=Iodidimonas sp. SYSU 1G8 TaxID=3133967 RepID=UPI0031FF0E11